MAAFGTKVKTTPVDKDKKVDILWQNMVELVALRGMWRDLLGPKEMNDDTVVDVFTILRKERLVSRLQVHAMGPHIVSIIKK
ncbi:MAG: hypothetical protein J6A79_14650 [Clostridia bacterium]|nr:hypothetical protein [Clostridia bacterium]